ncbi:MAG: glycosyltransferase family 9 protein [Terriglobales bacterium]
MSPSQAPAEISRLLIVRLGSLGDIIHTLPAVSFLRRIYPAAVFGWAVEQRWVSLLSSESAIAAPRSPQKPLVDVVHVVDTLAWRSALLSNKTWRGVHDSLEELRSLPYDVAIDFQGAWKSAILAQLSRAPRRLGFAQPREKPATLFYTHQIPARGRHVVERNLSLAEGLTGLRPGEHAPSFPLPLDPAAERAADEQLRAHGLHSFVLINPGAGWGAKCWPAERYAEVARALARHGLRAIVNYGPGEEQLAGDVARASEGVAIALSPPLSELVAFSRRARLCVGGDTGPVHLAAAFGVPVVALFGPTDPARNGPCGGPSIVLRSEISRTTSSHHKEPEAGLLQISAAEVIAAARHLLAQPAEVRR